MSGFSCGTLLKELCVIQLLCVQELYSLLWLVFLHSLVYLMLSAACCQNRIYVSFDDEWQMKAVGWEEN